MASAAQIELFRQLTEKRQFTDAKDKPLETGDLDKLRVTFGELSTKNASDWIDKALTLPMRDDSTDPAVPPPF